MAQSEGRGERPGLGVSGRYLYLCICICVFVFACLTPGNIVFGVLVPRASQKYSTCMVYTEFLISGRNPPLEGGGGAKNLL